MSNLPAPAVTAATIEARQHSSNLRVMHFCFDVFDTLITRSVGDPNHVFLLLGALLRARNEIACTAEVFARQRMLAEMRANQAAGRHAKLEIIYIELLQALDLPASAIAGFMSAEMHMEQACSRKIPSSDRLLAAARADGDGTVTFVTDTNLPSGFIRTLLDGHGMWQPHDRIFASCDEGVDKARGLMFPHVAECLGVSPRRNVLHGNDPVADVRNGRLSGWRVRHVRDANINRYERALAGHAYATGGLTSIFAGASRLARLASSTDGDRAQTLRAVSAGVMAPTLTAWTLWLIRRAQSRQLQRLYFISRDGQVLLDIARKLEPILKTGIDFRYLYGSRQAVQFAGAPEAAIASLLRLENSCVQDVLELLQISQEALMPILPSALCDTKMWRRDMTAAERAQLLAALSDPAAKALLQERATQVRALLLDYLRQEGWADGQFFGLVDVGWRGSMARALRTGLHGSSLSMPDCFLYFGLSDDSREDANSTAPLNLEAWFFDDALGRGLLPYPKSITSLIEMFCAADHGPVSGYRRVAGEVMPILRTAASPMAEWGLDLLREPTRAFVDAFVDAVHDCGGSVPLDADPRHAIRDVLELFWLHPTPAEVSHWKTFPVETTLNNTGVMPLAAPIRLGSIVRSMRGGQSRLRPQHSWPRGTIIASAKPYGIALSLVLRLKQAMPRWRKRGTWLKRQVLLLRDLPPPR